ncbi:ATP-binding cassette domain-containing protein [Halobacteria archaeon AArc-curdl1]|uniref:ATP-binding cassette domain-containing protein n=1 Tax=Natronosalvus hydrolyticus TaxID=2979988 RepID=A0AAP3E7V4_9EURY|nr:ATP-binding cassette domain-containing protein [Halobacteria archaeon AArc-curdl1]
MSQPLHTDRFEYAPGDQIQDEIAVFDDKDPLLRVENLSKHFPIYEGIIKRQVAAVRAVDDVSFTVPRGQTFGLVGESGSGKTTLGRSILRITDPTHGTVEVDGTDVTSLSGGALKKQRKDMQMVFQDPSSSLNPRKTIKQIIETPMKIHDIGSAGERAQRVEELLEMVDLPREFMYKYPSSLSGGQKQRVGIARAVAVNPKLVVLDEPTSALDVSVQARVIEILNDLQKRFDLTYIFISHDLSLIKNVSDRIGVLYLGRFVETGDVDSVFQDPQHPYTRALLSAIPTVTDEDRQYKPPELTLEGEIPDPREKPTGCAFRSRCPEAFEPCAEEEPAMYQTDSTRCSRCYLHDEAYQDTGGSDDQ